jgi:hypothetical protein
LCRGDVPTLPTITKQTKNRGVFGLFLFQELDMKGSLAEHILQSQGLEYRLSYRQRRSAKRRTVTGNRPHLFVTGGNRPHFIVETEPMKFECDCQHFIDGRVCIHIVAVIRSILPPESFIAPQKQLTPKQKAQKLKRQKYFKKRYSRQPLAATV